MRAQGFCALRTFRIGRRGFASGLTPAFTLVELLIVTGIIGLLIAMLLPTLSKARVHARRIQDLSNIRQLAMACVTYAGENKGSWPLGSRVGPDPTVPGTRGDDLVWINSYTFAYFLKYMDSATAADNFLSTSNPNPNGLAPTARQQLPLTCTSYYEDDNTNYTRVGSLAARFLDPTFTGTYLGYIYWGRRSNSLVGPIYDEVGNALTPTVKFVYPVKQGVRSTSKVLLSCPAYVGSAAGSTWVGLPHCGSSDHYVWGPLVAGPYDRPTRNTRGECFAYTDGSASWVPRGELYSVMQLPNEWVYFDLTR